MAFTPRTWGHQHHRLAPRRQPPRRRSAEPRLERLEDRTVLSTLTVMNNADIGLGSLRAAIITANTNGDPTNTITFAPRLAGRTITLTSGELAITKSLDIEGPGADKLTISGNDASRVFEIGRRATVTLANLTIANGWTISNQVVSKRGKVVSGELGGGGILNDADATLNLTSCAVVNNQAIAGDKLDVFGGGLLNLGTATVTSSTFTGNKAMGGGNSSTIFTGSQGGGIDNFGGATLKVDYSTFINNQVIGADTLSGEDIAGANFGVGGAIENNAGFDVKHPHPSTATISNSTFTGNLATAGTDSTANGGAIGNEFSGATVTLINSTLTGNQAIGGLGSNKERSFVVSQGIGGGISNSGGSKLTVMNSTLSDNQAIAGDHSIPTSANPLTGAGIGGGIANFVSGELTVMNSTLIGNLAQGGAGTVGPGGSGAGGGIENSFFSTATITNSTLSSNRAIAGPGGSGASVPTGLGFGGGIDDSFNATAMTIINSTLIGNQAIGSDGSYGANGGVGLGGGIVVGINKLLGYDPADYQPDTSSLIVSGSTFTGNLAQGGAGGAGANGGNGWGGGLIVFYESTATLDNCNITRNRAIGGAAGSGGSDGSGIGGGLNVDFGATVLLKKKTRITGNFASTSNNDVFGSTS